MTMRMSFYIPSVVVATSLALLGTSSAFAEVNLRGFELKGDPESSSGATFTYESTDDGVQYDLNGKLHKPSGSGLFPAVVLNHGREGSANTFVTKLAISDGEMVSWGLVAIGCDLTHGRNWNSLPDGGQGASKENSQRIHKCYEILGELGYVDMGRVAIHGHSMGAFATAAAAGAYPNDFLVASHTAGGVSDTGGIATSPNEAEDIAIPYQMHHGDEDRTVPLKLDENLATILEENGVARELIVYPGYDHRDNFPDIDGNGLDSYGEIREWYERWGLFNGRLR